MTYASTQYAKYFNSATKVAMTSEICCLIGLFVTSALSGLILGFNGGKNATMDAGGFISMSLAQTSMLIIFLALLRHGRMIIYANERSYYYAKLLRLEHKQLFAYMNIYRLLFSVIVAMCAGKFSFVVAQGLANANPLTVLAVHWEYTCIAVNAVCLHWATLPFRPVRPALVAPPPAAG